MAKTKAATSFDSSKDVFGSANPEPRKGKVRVGGFRSDFEVRNRYGLGNHNKGTYT